MYGLLSIISPLLVVLLLAGYFINDSSFFYFLVEYFIFVLRYKPEGCRFDSRWDRIFSLT